jgi:hypothetical protein
MNGSITDSAALTQYVNGSGNVSRVIGYSNNSTITNISAWQGMSENGGAAFNTTENLYGKNVTSVDVWNTYGSAAVWAPFTSDIWKQGTAGKYQLPILTSLAIPDADASYLMPDSPMPFVPDSGGADDGSELLAAVQQSTGTPTLVPGTPTETPVPQHTEPADTATPTETPAQQHAEPADTGTPTQTAVPVETEAAVPAAGILAGFATAAILRRK